MKLIEDRLKHAGRGATTPKDRRSIDPRSIQTPDSAKGTPTGGWRAAAAQTTGRSGALALVVISAHSRDIPTPRRRVQDLTTNLISTAAVPA